MEHKPEIGQSGATPLQRFSNSNQRFYGVDDAANALREFSQRWDDRMTFERLSFAEDYANGRYAIVLYVKPSASSYWRHEPAIGGDRQGQVGKPILVLVFKIDPCQTNGGNHGDEKPMFVENVEFVQGPEGVIPSLMRSYVIEDECGNGGEGPLYWSLVEGIYKIIPSFVEREVTGRVVFTDMAQDFAPHKIEGAAKVVDCVTNDEGKLLGRFLGGVKPEQIFPGCGVYIDSYAIGLRFEKDAQAGFKLIDMAVGPFDL